MLAAVVYCRVLFLYFAGLTTQHDDYEGFVIPKCFPYTPFDTPYGTEGWPSWNWCWQIVNDNHTHNLTTSLATMFFVMCLLLATEKDVVPMF